METLLGDEVLLTVGLTWSSDADAAAIKVRQALGVLGGGAPVMLVSDIEATEALIRGIADLTGDHFLVACIIEADAVVVGSVNGPHVTVERFEPDDSGALADRICVAVRRVRPHPDRILVLGSADGNDLVSALRDATTRPVLTAAEGGYALTQGAALASTRAMHVPDAPEARARISRVGVLSSALAAAAVVFVVSVSLAASSCDTGFG